MTTTAAPDRVFRGFSLPIEEDYVVRHEPRERALAFGPLNGGPPPSYYYRSPDVGCGMLDRLPPFPPALNSPRFGRGFGSGLRGSISGRLAVL